MSKCVDTRFPCVDTSADDPVEQVQALGHVAPQAPDPPGRLLPAFGGIDSPPELALPPADPQSDPSPRSVPGLAGGLPRSRASYLAFPRAPLDEQLHRLQTLLVVLVVAVPDA